MISGLGVGQIFAWGSSYYLLAILAKPIAEQMGWPLTWVVGGLSLGLLAAGLASPALGRRIERYGGRSVLIASALLLAAGLSVLASAQHLAVYLAGWIIVGLGMGAGLYDPAFATLGRLYGRSARSAITALTLFGGLASTVCWPISTLLVTELGWRGTCLAYAAFHVAVMLPLYLLVLPSVAPRRDESRPMSGRSEGGAAERDRAGAVGPAAPRLFILLAVAITVSSMISTLVSVHLMTILQSRGMSLAGAVALGALVGPSQVGARLIELAIARYHHPIWTKIVSTLLVALGLGALWAGLPVLPLALAFYGAGIGLESIARGTLPLAVFGERDYATRMGQLAMPSLIAQATAPSIGAALLEATGSSGALTALSLVAVANFVVATALFVTLRRPHRSPRGV